MGPRLDVVGIVVAGMAASRAFYRRLGFDVPAEADGEPHVEASLPGRAADGLGHDRDDPFVRPRGRWAPASGERIGLAFVCDRAEEVDAAYRELVDAGYEGHLEPWEAFWSQRYTVVHDPPMATG